MEQGVALISGAGRGIGRAVAVELARLNFRLALLSRTESELRETERLVGESLVLPVDAKDARAINDAVAQCVHRFGRLDAVVHCAGVAPLLKIDATSDQQWHEVIDTNLSAGFYLARAAWPIFRRQGGGAVVNISSIASRDPFPGLGIYGAAKAGLNMLGLALAREGRPLGIRVHTIAPGAVETAMLRKIMRPDELPREMTLEPQEVAAIVAQCITGELKHTSGEVIWVHQALPD